MYPRALFATALLVALPVVSASASDDSRDDARDGGRSGQSMPSRGTTPSLEGGGKAAPEGVQEKNVSTPTTDSSVASSVETHVTGDNLQTARKPDESPFSEIKILPSF